jgi:hypothetical protein
MTVISDTVRDVAGRSDDAEITFYVQDLRGGDSTGITTTRRVRVPPVDGVLTTPDLTPGPAKVEIGTKKYDIVIPDEVETVGLWPLIDAGMPTPPPGAPGFVRNAGGISRITRVTEAELAAIEQDPETFYVVFPNP